MAVQRSGRGTTHSTSAFTLVEMLVALLVLGVVLTATAASLIGFTRQALADERRFQATGLSIEILEEFQALPWDSISVAPRELTGDIPDAPDPDNELLGVRLDDARHLGDDLDLAALEGLDLAAGDTPESAVTFAGPDGLSAEVVLGLPESLSEDVMPAYERVLDRRDGREYDVYRIVTWVERPGVDPSAGPVRGIKRLTTVVRWEILGREYEETFVAERAPEVREAGAFGLPQLIQYSLVPNPAQVCGAVSDYALLPTQGFDVAVRFSRPVHAARIVLPVIDDLAEISENEGIYEIASTDLGAHVLALPVEVVEDTYFVGLELAADQRFPVGSLPVRIEVEQELGGGFETVATRTLEIRGPAVDDIGCGQDPVRLIDGTTNTSEPVPEDPPPDAVDIGAITLTGVAGSNPATVLLYRVGNSGKVESCRDLSIRVRIDRLIGGEVVNLVSVAGGAPVSRTMSADPSPPIGEDPTGDSDFVFTFDQGDDFGFRADQRQTTFDIRVERGGDIVGFEIGPSVRFVELDKQQACTS